MVLKEDGDCAFMVGKLPLLIHGTFCPHFSCRHTHTETQTNKYKPEMCRSPQTTATATLVNKAGYAHHDCIDLTGSG